jgi:tetratricopeptide (TPR) repeat protein
VTVQPSFRLVDSNTGQDWYTWTPAEPIMVSEEDKPSFFFGSGKSEADLTPRDRIIAGCVQNAIVEFTSHLIPTSFEVEVPVISSTNKSCIQGVKYLRTEDYETALQMFKQALADKPADDCAAFCAGVTAEKLGQYESAINYYNQALMTRDEPQYKESRDRVKQFKDRTSTGS